MNIFEVFGLAFITVVAINLVSMIWAIKKAPRSETPNITNEQEA